LRLFLVGIYELEDRQTYLWGSCLHLEIPWYWLSSIERALMEGDAHGWGDERDASTLPLADGKLWDSLP
jgi:hypothetical protein